jgi:hypothetical protein
MPPLKVVFGNFARELAERKVTGLGMLYVPVSVTSRSLCAKMVLIPGILLERNVRLGTLRPFIERHSNFSATFDGIEEKDKAFGKPDKIVNSVCSCARLNEMGVFVNEGCLVLLRRFVGSVAKRQLYFLAQRVVAGVLPNFDLIEF